MLLTPSSGLRRFAPRAQRVSVYPRCFHMLPCRLHGAPSGRC